MNEFDDLLGKYPIDFSKLSKGDEFTGAQLEEILGAKVGTDKFQFSRMGLQAMVHDKTGFTAKCMPDGGLRILTDPEAAEHNARLFYQALRSAEFRHERNLQVDVEQLTEDQRKKHDRQLLIQSRYISAMAKTTKALVGGKKPKQIEGDKSGGGESLD